MPEAVTWRHIVVFRTDKGDVLDSPHPHTSEIDGAPDIQSTHVIAEIRLNEILALLAAGTAKIDKRAGDQHDTRQNERADLRKIRFIVIRHGDLCQLVVDSG